MKYLLSEKICNRIIDENQLSLELASYMGITQQSVLKHAKNRHESLVNASQIEFFKSKGYTYEEIVVKVEEKSR